MGLGFLSKYTAMMQWACWALVFILWPQARARLREKGPWLALAINLVCTTPVIVWNMQHGWITVAHVATNGGLNKAWKFNPKFFLEFTGAEWGLLNPVFAVATFLAACWFWPRRRERPLFLYLFCMGAPVFLFYWMYTIRYRVLVNWIAPSVLPLLALMVVYWEDRWREGNRGIKKWMWGGLILGWSLTLLALVPALLFKMPFFPQNARLDPLRRLRAWSETARVIDTARQKLQAEGKPAFIITDHYGIAGHCSFYLPDARAAIKQEAMVYFRTTDTPENQFFFWKGYTGRTGQSAIYVEEHNEPDPPNPRIIQQFETVEDLGIFEVKYKGLVYRRLQLWACRNLK
jgi:undecaprenyl-diphosphatase